MTYTEKPIQRKKHAAEVCNMCGKPSRDTICAACSDKLRVEALAHKKHEEKGD
jgi:recombinational DNA repair protein RecR